MTNILTAQPKQISLKDDGALYFQPDSTNPLPGNIFAKLEKGESILQPRIVITDPAFAEDAINDHISLWLKAYIYQVLEPLMNLVAGEELSGSAQDIAYKLFQNLGVVSRQELEGSLSQLDADGRKVLRAKKVKLGPLLAFLPDLNKPAAIRLRALLWSLYHDKALPAPVPRDGAVSTVVDTQASDKEFLSVIGYPVYGPRAVRIDMLDRVISAVYDSAKDGRFRPTHMMAEWMGCSIADLYAILEAMGHKHIPAPVVSEALESSEGTEPQESADTSSQEENSPAEPVKIKPLLDEFILRRGKAHQEQAQRSARSDRERPKREFTKQDRVKGEKTQIRPESDNFKKKTKLVRSSDEPRDHKRSEKFDRRDKKEKSEDREPRVFSAEAKQDDNPFAVLLQLKKN